jgi:hypothetical protein
LLHYLRFSVSFSSFALAHSHDIYITQSINLTLHLYLQPPPFVSLSLNGIYFLWSSHWPHPRTNYATFQTALFFNSMIHPLWQFIPITFLHLHLSVWARSKLTSSTLMSNCGNLLCTYF